MLEIQPKTPLVMPFLLPLTTLVFREELMLPGRSQFRLHLRLGPRWIDVFALAQT
jgi:hypothetical protein